MADDDQDPSTKREVPIKKAWMAPTAAATLAPPAPPSLALSVFDPPTQRFAETGELGRGGMGRVVEALDRALGRSVAIKQSLATSSTDLARFEREARITAQLQHPSIVPILDVGRDADGKPFYIMRKIEGEPLATRVEAAKDVRERLALLSSLLGAIDGAAYAHAKHVVHRDIKPWNILLGPFGETLLIDWGIARELDQDEPEADEVMAAAETTPALTRFGRAYGTPGFLSPEQARGEPVDARADVYSLGATLYYVLTGKVPFGIDGPTAAIERAAADETPDLAAIPDEVPQELTAIATKALAPKPDDRYADAGELAADLRRFLAGQLVAAHDYTARERIVKWVRRHKVAVTVGALAMLAIAIISIVSLRRVIHDRDAAEVAEALAVDRADESLLDRARLLLATDPTSSLAALRDLDPSSSRWPTAYALARAAVSGGIDRRIGVHSRHVTGLAFSPDGARVASGSGELAVYDLASRTSRIVARSWVNKLAWWGPRKLAFLNEEKSAVSLQVVDIETDAIRTLDAEAPLDLVILGDRLIVLTKLGKVIAYERDGTTTELIENGAQAIAARGTRLVAMATAWITVLDPSGKRTWPTSGQVPNLLVMSEDANRLAVLGAGVVREWNLTGDPGTPREWQRPKTAAGGIEYVGNQLIGWASDGSGFVALGDPSRPLWTKPEQRPGVLPRHVYPFQGGALFATDYGALAIYTSQGVNELPRRLVGLTRVDIEASGRWIALGLGSGEVLLVDLRDAIPVTIPIARTAQLSSFTAGKVVVTGVKLLHNTEPDALQIDGVSLLDLETRQLVSTHQQLARNEVVTDQGLVIGSSRARRHHWVWNDRAELLFEVDRVDYIQVEDGLVYWLDDDSKVWSRTTKPVGEPKLFVHLQNYRTRFTDGDARPPLMQFQVFKDALVVSTLDSAKNLRPMRITPAGLEPIPTAPGAQSVAGRSGDLWWTKERDPDHRALWRGDQLIPVRHPVDTVRFARDRLWAIGENRLTEVDQSGRILRELELPDNGNFSATDDSLLVTSVGGVVELTPAHSARRRLFALGEVENVVGSSDGKRVVAMTKSAGGSRQLVYWTNSVPEYPAALRAYLASVTNARLELGSTVLRWDP